MCQYIVTVCWTNKWLYCSGTHNFTLIFSASASVFHQASREANWSSSSTISQSVEILSQQEVADFWYTQLLNESDSHYKHSIGFQCQPFALFLSCNNIHLQSSSWSWIDHTHLAICPWRNSTSGNYIKHFDQRSTLVQ